MNSFSLTLPKIGKYPFIFSTGELARQANGSVVVSYADTVVLVTVCAAKDPKEDLGFLPLTVEYQARTYAMGKIPGGYIKREGRPKDDEILSARLIDRPLRPLFPEGFSHEVQVITMVLSSDGNYDPDVLALNAASCALFISDIPFSTPIGVVRVARCNGELMVNPTYEQRQSCQLDLVVVGSGEKIVMLEGVGQEVPEKDLLEAIEYAQPFIREIIKGQLDFRNKLGETEGKYSIYQPSPELYKIVQSESAPYLEKLFGLVDKQKRWELLEKMFEDLTKLITEEKGLEHTQEEIKVVFYQIEKAFVRKKILEEGRRPDLREPTQIRALDCKVRTLPRTHGSAIFTRGQTQSLAITTLGTSSDEQLIDALEGERTKHFMLHYSFPPFSVGEVKFLRGPSRREVGHGALAEKALANIIPSKEDFPYTIRVVSEILESNGSSSMATVCAASLSLMDAGVPIKKPVAGIALGLVYENEKYRILTDIAGVEDHYGDMDFKVAGTDTGISAIQVDVKIDGLTLALIKEALQQAREGRLFILDKMNQALSLPREGVSQYAPKIKSFKIDLDKIGEVIGPGGRIIRRLIRENNVSIDIDDESGVVSVVAENEENLERAVSQIESLTREIQVGEVWPVKVTKITNFGAFAEISPGKSGLIHISEISDKFVKDAREFLSEDDIVQAKVINIDPQGRITLSIKQAQ